MNPSMSEVTNQKIHVDVDASVTMRDRKKGQNMATKGVNGRYFQKVSWSISAVGMV